MLVHRVTAATNATPEPRWMLSSDRGDRRCDGRLRVPLRSIVTLFAVRFRNAGTRRQLVRFGAHRWAAHAHRPVLLDNHDARCGLFNGLHPDHLDRQLRSLFPRGFFVGGWNLRCRALRLCRHRSRLRLSCAALRRFPLRRFDALRCLTAFDGLSPPCRYALPFVVPSFPPLMLHPQRRLITAALDHPAQARAISALRSSR